MNHIRNLAKTTITITTVFVLVWVADGLGLSRLVKFVGGDSGYTSKAAAVVSFPANVMRLVGEGFGGSKDVAAEKETNESRILGVSQTQGQVLADHDIASTNFGSLPLLKIRIPAEFDSTVSVEDRLTAGESILDSLTVTNGSTLNGDTTIGGRATISDGLSVTGSSTLAGAITGGSTLTLTGNLTAPNVVYSVAAGSGISVSGTQTITITNSDLGSDQNIFSKFKLGETTVEAGSNTDTFTFASGTGTSLSLADKTLTISTNTGWIKSGTYAILSTLTDYVGIGTATPTSKLEVDSGSSGTSGLKFTNLTSSSTVGVGGGKVLSVDSGGNVILVTDEGSTSSGTLEAMLPGAATGSTIYYDGATWGHTTNLFHDGGSVGISTITPQGRLEVFSNNASTIGLVVRGATSQTANLQEWRSQDGTTLSYIDENGIYNGSFNGNLTGTVTLSGYTQGSVPFVGASGDLVQDNSNLFWDDTNNRLGVGTAAPTTMLEVRAPNNTAAYSGILLRSTSLTNISPAIEFGNSNVSLYRSNLNSKHNLVMNVYDDLLISSSNNGAVAIGTTSPASKLHVAGGYAGNALMTLNQTNSVGDIFTASASGVAKMTLTNAGYLGIGTSVPTSILHVNDSFSGATTYAGIKFASTRTNSVGDTSTATYFQDNQWTVAGTSAISNTIGLHNLITLSSTGTNNVVRSIVGRINMSGSGRGNNLALFQTHFQGDSTGTINSLRLVDIDNFTNASNTISNTYGLYIGDLTAGTQTNTPFSVYSSDANTYNYFAGNTGFGITAPISKLHVSGGYAGNSLMTLDQTNSVGDIFTASASGVAKMTLTNAGYLGIGTANPGTHLDIEGPISFSQTAYFYPTSNANYGKDKVYQQSIRNNGGIWYFTGLAGEELTVDLNAGSASTLSVSQGDLVFDNNASNEDIYLKVSPGGADITALAVQGTTSNVGIGTSSPTSKLHVSGGYAGNALMSLNQTNSVGDIFTASASGVAKMTLTNAGYLGIGTANPNYPLSVYLPTNGIASFAQNLTTTGIWGVNIGLLSQGGEAQITTRSTPLVFLTGGTVNTMTAGTERMRVDTTGNVGIGSTSPTSKLHTEGSYAGNALVRFNETGSNDIFTASASGTTRMVLTNAGYLGVGTANPSSVLHINGTLNDDVVLKIQRPGTGSEGMIEFLTADAQTTWQVGFDDDGTNSFQLRNTRLNKSVMKVTDAFSAEVVFNEDALDHDFRIEGDTNANLFFVDASADMAGIGTSSPAYKLDISGGQLGLRVTSSTHLDTILRAAAASQNYISYYQNTTARFASGIDTSGNYQLMNMALSNQKAMTITNASNNITFNEDGADQDLRIEGDTDANLFFVDASADRVGIGTSSPSYKFQVNTSSANTSYLGDLPQQLFALRNTDTTNNNWTTMNFLNSSGIQVASIATQNVDNTNNYGALSFGTKGADGYLQRLTIDQNGSAVFNESGNSLSDLRIEGDTDANLLFVDSSRDNVGIGTGSPNASYKLHVNGAIYLQGQTIIEGANLGLNLGGSGVYMYLDQDASGNFQFRNTSDVLQAQINQTGAAIFNEQGNDADFRVEGDTDANLLFVDASADSVAIGTATTANYSLLRLDRLFSNLGDYVGSGVYGIYNSVRPYNTTSSTGVATGTYNSVVSNAGSTLGFTSFVGTNNVVTLSAPVALSTLYGDKSDLTNSNASSTISSLYGNSVSLTNSGTITNTYGYYVGDITSGTQTNSPFSFYAADANAYNYFAGNVGIGTTSPASKLHVAGGYAGNALVWFNETGGNDILTASASGTTKFRLSNDGSVIAAQGADWAPSFTFLNDPDTGMFSPNTNELGFSVNSSRYLTITSGGFFSISENVSRIQIAGGSVGVPIINFGNVSSDSDTGIYRVGADQFGIAAGGVNSATYGTTGMTIPGSVGIGSGTTASKLFVEGTFAGNALATFNETGSNDILTASASGITRMTLGNTGILTLNSNNDSDATVRLSEAGTTQWNIYNDGDNTDRLYITDNDNDNGLYLDQDATSWTANSDIRLKENIQTINNALEKVMALSGVSYTWINGSTTREIGVIAQEVAAAGLTELVSVGKNGYLGIRYDRLAPVLIEAIKEQQLTINNLGKLTSNNQINTANTIDQRILGLETTVATHSSQLESITTTQNQESFLTQVFSYISGKLQVMVETVFTKPTEFMSRVRFGGQVDLVNKAGVLEIPAGKNRAKVLFGEKLGASPVVSLTGENVADSEFVLENVSVDGFEVKLKNRLDRGVKIHWVAVAGEGTNVEYSEDGVVNTELSPSPTLQATPSPSPDATASESAVLGL